MPPKKNFGPTPSNHRGMDPVVEDLRWTCCQCRAMHYKSKLTCDNDISEKGIKFNLGQIGFNAKKGATRCGHGREKCCPANWR